MILMAGLVRLPVKAIGAIGLLIIALHNAVMPRLIPALPDGGVAWYWKILYVGFFAGPIQFGIDGPGLVVLYSIVPWIGVMAAGYAFGRIMTMDPGRRDRTCLATGLGGIALFLLLRGVDLYGDPRSWAGQLSGSEWAPPMPAFLAFLNTTKYPASLSFLLMTLGPAIALIPLLERARGLLAQWIGVFGRVPFFYYVLHLPLIHALALVVSKVRTGAVNPWLFTNHPMANPPVPDGYTWSLPLLYLVWAIAILMLYPACRWFAGLKATRKDRWLSYL
jgi:uncharacterized membrane protein